MKDHADALPAISISHRPGRPSKPDVLTPAQRSKAYRAGLKDKGLTAVKFYLEPVAMAYLGALCEVHRITISEAVAMAVSAALRGESLPLVIADEREMTTRQRPANTAGITLPLTDKQCIR